MELERDPPPELYQAPANATHYQISSDKGVRLLPIHNVILDDKIVSEFMNLRRKIGMDFYKSDPEINMNLSIPIPTSMKNLFNDFVQKQPLEPVVVRAQYVISNPSPSGHLKGDHSGLGAPMITKYPILDDYMYQVIDGHQKVSLSLFFNYRYLPVIIRV